MRFNLIENYFNNFKLYDMNEMKFMENYNKLKNTQRSTFQVKSKRTKVSLMHQVMK